MVVVSGICPALRITHPSVTLFSPSSKRCGAAAPKRCLQEVGGRGAALPQPQRLPAGCALRGGAAEDHGHAVRRLRWHPAGYFLQGPALRPGADHARHPGGEDQVSAATECLIWIYYKQIKQIPVEPLLQ